MSTTPSTLIVFTDDPENFPIRMAVVVMKQLFQYGVNHIKVKGDKIFISLTYCPKGITLKKKFGNLPIRYIRSKLDTDDEFGILEKVVRRYKFNLLDEEPDDAQHIQIEAARKRKLYLQAPHLEEIEDEEDNEDDKLKEKSSSSSSLSSSSSSSSSKRQIKRSSRQPEEDHIGFDETG